MLKCVPSVKQATNKGQYIPIPIKLPRYTQHKKLGLDKRSPKFIEINYSQVVLSKKFSKTFSHCHPKQVFSSGANLIANVKTSCSVIYPLKEYLKIFLHFNYFLIFYDLQPPNYEKETQVKGELKC